MNQRMEAAKEQLVESALAQSFRDVLSLDLSHREHQRQNGIEYINSERGRSKGSGEASEKRTSTSRRFKGRPSGGEELLEKRASVP